MVTSTGPALGMPTPDALRASAAKAADARITCSTQVVGVTEDRKIIIRTLTNATIDEEKQSFGALPFDPSGTAFFEYHEIKHGYTMGIRAVNPHRRPAIFTVKQLNGKPNLTFTTKRMGPAHFTAGVFAGSAGYYVFAVVHGTVTRWTTFKDRRGHLSYGDPRVVARSTNLTTLSFTFRKKVPGGVSDVLWGTTRAGELVQLRVPIDDPRDSRLRIVKRRGFDDVSDISLGFCGGHASTLSIIAIDGSANEATWYTVRDQFAPRASNVTNRGLAGDGADWRIHATF
jgi:hypothetical protein